MPETRATATLESAQSDPMNDDDWSPIRGSESPHHLSWKQRVARQRGLCEEDRDAANMNVSANDFCCCKALKYVSSLNLVVRGKILSNFDQTSRDCTDAARGRRVAGGSGG